MKKSRFSDEQIIGILKQHQAGVKTADLYREDGISSPTFYAWKSGFGHREVNEAQRLREMEDENRRLCTATTAAARQPQRQNQNENLWL